MAKLSNELLRINNGEQRKLFTSNVHKFRYREIVS